MNCDITESYLNQIYENLSREHLRLMTDMKNITEADEKQKELDIQKQVTMLNTLLINVLKFRNLRKAILLKGVC